MSNLKTDLSEKLCLGRELLAKLANNQFKRVQAELSAKACDLSVAIKRKDKFLKKIYNKI